MSFPDFPELCVDLASGHRHYDRLRCTNFFFGYALFLGNSKVMLYSGVAGKCKGCRQMYQYCCLLVEMRIVTRRVIEVCVGLLLIDGQHLFLRSLEAQRSV